MRIGVPKETLPGETRVASTPEVVKKLVAKGFSVVVERGAGSAALSTGTPNRPYLAVVLDAGFVEIADTANGADDILHVREVERLAQTPDMHIDRAFIHVDIVAPDAIQQLRAGKDAPRR